ncbi:MAG: hisS [Candidatus Saccharibacteria bacterium]|nr:hisS [Candidatus Saccharibacteria bacterium]
MEPLSSLPYKGTRDYYPEDKRVQNYIFAKWRKVVEGYGYEEYGAPMIEQLEVYAAKSGQEIANEQTYSFTDRGGRIVAIRPEMTPSISRMVAARRQQLAYPARLYSIANFMRYERPQRGREREFWQLNVDLFGLEGSQADAEMIGMADAILKAFGSKADDYTIKINSRNLVNFMMVQYLGLDSIQTQQMIRLLDRKDKITASDFDEQAQSIFGELAEGEGLERLRGIIEATSIGQLPREIRDSSAFDEVHNLFEALTKQGTDSVVFDIALMRGLDYYTGIVFEVFDTHPDNNRSLFGGGRYDGLVGLFGAEPISAIGMAPGGTTFEQFLQVHDLLPKLHSTTDIYIVVLSDDARKGAATLARNLREDGVNVEFDFTGRKIDKQIKTAVKKAIPYLVFVGDQEIKNEIYTIKDTASTEEQTMSAARIVSFVKDRRRNDTTDDDLI